MMDFKTGMSANIRKLKSYTLSDKKIKLFSSMLLVKNKKYIDRYFMVVKPETVVMLLSKAGLYEEAESVLSALDLGKKEISTFHKRKRAQAIVKRKVK